jgi:hypothetical protein
MSPAGKKRTKHLVAKVKNAGFWQRFNKGGSKNSTQNAGTTGKTNTRELRGHEHPKEPERNKK